MGPNSQDGQLRFWNEFLKAVRENAAELEGVAPFLAALEGTHREAVSLRSRRDDLSVATREATRQLNKAFAAGQDAASVLRSYIRATLGPRNEKLLVYGIKPIRKRRRYTRKSPCTCGLVS